MDFMEELKDGRVDPTIMVKLGEYLEKRLNKLCGAPAHLLPAVRENELILLIDELEDWFYKKS